MVLYLEFPKETRKVMQKASRKEMLKALQKAILMEMSLVPTTEILRVDSSA